MDLFFIVMMPALSASLLLLWPRTRSPYWVSLVPAGIFLYMLFNSANLGAVSIPWVPSLGMGFDLFADGLGLLFGLIVTGIGTLVLIYAGGYFEDAADYRRFSGYILVF